MPAAHPGGEVQEAVGFLDPKFINSPELELLVWAPLAPNEREF